MSDNKTSLLVNRQVPEFVREEYPLFIAFLEAYYEFLENKQGSQKNDLTKIAKDIRDLPDVDSSIDDFESNFFNTYAKFVPKDVAVDKAFIIKNILPLYLSKGSEKSFKLLFRMMFGSELEVKYPKAEVLRASDGKWSVEKALKVTNLISSFYTGNGTNDVFTILIQAEPTDISVYVNGALKTHASDYYIRKESQQVVFENAPANGTDIEIYYNTIDVSIFSNRKFTGESSSATALIERVEQRNIFNKTIYDLFVKDIHLVGSFDIGENIVTDIWVGTELIDVRLRLASFLQNIRIVNGGANYNVADPVIISDLFSTEGATAFVSKTYKGVIDTIEIYEGGSGFQIAKNVVVSGVSTDLFAIAIQEVDLTSPNTANTFTISSDVISHLDPANTTIDAVDYGFNSGLITTPNSNTVLAHAFGNTTYTLLGEISKIQILKSNVSFGSTPPINAEPASILIANTGYTTEPTTVLIDTFGSLGKMNLVFGGLGYEKGDELVFHNGPMCFGVGAAAEVLSVDLTGKITSIDFVPYKLEGTANVTSVSNVMVHGTGTYFERDLIVGDRIMIGGETRNVVTIASNTSLNVDSYFSSISINKAVRKHGLYLLGGQGFSQDNLPTVTVTSTSGAGAQIVVKAVMGDGEVIDARGVKRPGEIEEIVVYTPGEGYTSVPYINLSGYGDGTAEAEATLVPSYEIFEGKWTTSDSILSSVDRKLAGKDYYMNYSYLLSSGVEFSRYKQVFKDLLHPTGFKAYSELNRQDTITLNSTTAESVNTTEITIRTTSGRVNIANGSITVTGVGTKFNIANSIGMITIGTQIAVNSEIRTVNAISGNTILTVSSPFTVTANLQELTIIG